MIDATQWLDCADRLALLTRDEARRIAVNIAKPRSCNDENNRPDQQDKNRKASRQVQALCRTVSWTGKAVERPTRAHCAAPSATVVWATISDRRSDVNRPLSVRFSGFKVQAEPTITRLSALAPSPQPRPAPTARALPPKHVDQRGPFWTPIRGPVPMPIDKICG